MLSGHEVHAEMTLGESVMVTSYNKVVSSTKCNGIHQNLIVLCVIYNYHAVLSRMLQLFTHVQLHLQVDARASLRRIPNTPVYIGNSN